MNTLQTAQRYLASGFSVIPVKLDGTKAPNGAWEAYQKRKATVTDLQRWFKDDVSNGIGLVQGEVSGMAEMLEFETDTALADWEKAVLDHGRADLLEALNLRVRSGGGGIHFYYRCPDGIEGNQKLARFVDGTVKIETRGEGGQVVAPGSPLKVHKSGNPYTKTSGSFEAVPTITGEDRAFAFAIARSCNEHTPSGKKWTPATEARESTPKGNRPGDDYNARATQAEVIALLESHGWQIAGGRGDVCDLTRPGKSTREGTSGTVGYCGQNGFYCFTSSAPPFEPETYYDPFGLYVLLAHGGRFDEAAKELGAKGYGEARLPPARQESVKKAQKVKEISPDSEKAYTLADFQKTDAGNAEMLIWNHKKDIKYVSGLGWRVWNGKHWQEGGEKILEMARLTVRELLGHASDLLDQARDNDDKIERQRLVAQADALSKHALRSESGSRLAAMVTLATSFSEASAHADVFSLKPWRVAFQNGTWADGRWRDHQRQDFIEELLPVCYSPDFDCSEWLAVLDRITGGDADFALTLQDVAGYFLSGAAHLRLMCWSYGPKGTGKGTFAELLGTLLGNSSRVVDKSLLTGEREDERLGAAVRNARLLILQEAGRKRLDSEILKTLSGGDRIPCRLLYQSKSFNVLPTWGMLALSNDPPSVNAYDDALRDRVIALPFVHALADGESLSLTGHTRLEAARKDPQSALVGGFVSWAVDGLARVHQAQTIHRAAVVIAHTRRFWQDTDPLTEFWETLDHDTLRAGITRGDLRHKYEAWCQQEGGKPFPAQKFCDAARAFGLTEEKDGKGVRSWKLYGGKGSLWSGWEDNGTYGTSKAFSDKSLHERENIGNLSENRARSAVSAVSIREDDEPTNEAASGKSIHIGALPTSPTLPTSKDEDELEDPFAPGGAMYQPPRSPFLPDFPVPTRGTPEVPQCVQVAETPVKDEAEEEIF